MSRDEHIWRVTEHLLNSGRVVRCPAFCGGGTPAKPANTLALHLGWAWLRGKDDHSCTASHEQMPAVYRLIQTGSTICPSQRPKHSAMKRTAAVQPRLTISNILTHESCYYEGIHLHSPLVSKSRIYSFIAICGVMWIASGLVWGPLSAIAVPKAVQLLG